ncbi:hypothetical protein SAMN05444342_0698 [Haladaptatus paucihalophilus DX253]|uniref:Uncharacterized protein n=2 Tax=Haladaptatus paucihalophilus DX253 TaxID=797209 RepID=A0A1M6PZT2_HALPU|nr:MULTISPECIES: hypothetical protein [Haladaptatus]GKZ13644.1 hypothetical protein HAL_15250 [Haladaptatus sp. T7]SHK13402.1 hypothetical protein SAMN05444342_0698 [Haladaptatus paucihalophilus DX253]
MSQTEQQPEARERPVMGAAQESTSDIAILASAASVLLSWHQFFVRGNRERGLFIGLWPPTILAFASYFNQKRMEQRMESLKPSSIINSLDQMFGNR